MDHDAWPTHLDDDPVDNGRGCLRVVFQAVNIVHGHEEVVSGGQEKALRRLRVEHVAARLTRKKEDRCMTHTHAITLVRNMSEF